METPRFLYQSLGGTLKGPQGKGSPSIDYAKRLGQFVYDQKFQLDYNF